MMASMVPSQAVLVPPKASGPAAYFRLTQDAVDAILNANGQGVSMIVDNKNQMKLKVGSKLFSTSSIAEACPIDLYNVSPAPKLSSSSSSKQPASAPHLYGLGNVTTRVSVVQSSTGESTLASKLKSQSKTLREEKEANKAQLLSGAPSTLSAGRSSRRTSPSARPTSALGVAFASSANNHYHPRSVPGSPLINSPSSANSPSGSASSTTTSSHSSRPRTLQLGSSKPLVTQPLQSGPNRVVHLLALGPNTVQGLSQRTNLALTEVETIVAEYATRKPDGTFVLADNRYRELRIWEWKPYSNSERSKVIQDARAAFDRLGYPADSSARRMLVDPKIRKEKAESEKTEKDSDRTGDRTAESSPSVSPQKDPKQQQQQQQQQPKPNALKRVGALLKVSNPPAKKAKTASRSSSASEDDRQHTPTPRESTPRTASPMSASPKPKTGSASTPASKTAKAIPSSSSKSSPAPSTKASTTSTSTTASTASTSAPGKAKSAPKANGAGRPSSAASGKVDDDLFELARKFRQTYSEYEKLYAQVSSAERKKSRADVQKLLSMHRELESWKRKLWTVNPSNKV